MMNFKKYFKPLQKQQPKKSYISSHRDKNIARIAHEYADSGEYYFCNRLTKETKYHEILLDSVFYDIWDKISCEAFKYRGSLNCSFDALCNYANCKTEDKRLLLQVLLNDYTVIKHDEHGYYTTESRQRAKFVYNKKFTVKTRELLKNKESKNNHKYSTKYYARKLEKQGYVNKRFDIKLYTRTPINICDDLIASLISKHDIIEYIKPSDDVRRRRANEKRLASQPAYKIWHSALTELSKKHTDFVIQKTSTYHRHVQSLVFSSVDVNKLESALFIARARRTKNNSSAPLNLGLIVSILKTENFDKPKKNDSEQANFKPTFVVIDNTPIVKHIPTGVSEFLKQFKRQSHSPPS